ncbi:DUF3419 family protein [Cytophagaceae bacterium DM2B3-1]|uniref:DUF3419 family protein n=1 Tax=Xanthocytophaga flava TaxID=3048013 RepID=A0ABT7CV66_9BACT|nr:DUF3419 family protein [Xanthocytophaga flavus]MDJ1497670.1 DUF3419 family protein [Xanthocytophaga flavus]
MSQKQVTSFWKWGRLGKKMSKQPRLLFGQVWEDPVVEVALLKQVPDPQHICVVASAGCTAFSLAGHTSAQIAAIDINTAQIYFCQLKSALLQVLSYKDFLYALDKNAESFYKKVERLLPDETQQYWSDNLHLLSRGMNHAGFIDRKMTWFSTVFLKLVSSSNLFHQFLNLTDVEQQKQQFPVVLKEKRLKRIVSILLSKTILKWIFGKEVISRLPTDFSLYIFNKLQTWFTTTPLHSNPYIWQTFLQSYNYELENTLPLYLWPSVYKHIKEKLSNIHWMQSDMVNYLTTQPAASIHFFAMSNILEAMDEVFTARVLKEIRRTACQDALIVFRYIVLDPDVYIQQLVGFELINADEYVIKEQERSGICNNFRIYKIVSAIK